MRQRAAWRISGTSLQPSRRGLRRRSIRQLSATMPHLLARRAQGADAAARPRPRQTHADQTDRRGPIRRWTLECYRQDILPRLAMVSLPDIEQVTVTLESASTFLDHRLGMSSRAKSACATKSQCEFQRRTSNARRSTSRAIGRRRDAPLSIDPSVRAPSRATRAPIETVLRASTDGSSDTPLGLPGRRIGVQMMRGRRGLVTAIYTQQPAPRPGRKHRAMRRPRAAGERNSYPGGRSYRWPAADAGPVTGQPAAAS